MLINFSSVAVRWDLAGLTRLQGYQGIVSYKADFIRIGGTGYHIDVYRKTGKAWDVYYTPVSHEIWALSHKTRPGVRKFGSGATLAGAVLTTFRDYHRAHTMETISRIKSNFQYASRLQPWQKVEVVRNDLCKLQLFLKVWNTPILMTYQLKTLRWDLRVSDKAGHVHIIEGIHSELYAMISRALAVSA